MNIYLSLWIWILALFQHNVLREFEGVFSQPWASWTLRNLGCVLLRHDELRHSKIRLIDEPEILMNLISFTLLFFLSKISQILLLLVTTFRLAGFVTVFALHLFYAFWGWRVELSMHSVVDLIWLGVQVANVEVGNAWRWLTIHIAGLRNLGSGVIEQLVEVQHPWRLTLVGAFA